MHYEEVRHTQTKIPNLPKVQMLSPKSISTSDQILKA